LTYEDDNRNTHVYRTSTRRFARQSTTYREESFDWVLQVERAVKVCRQAAVRVDSPFQIPEKAFRLMVAAA
jgi:hypothetical protein